MTTKLFGTNGIRGDARQLFTPEFCYQIAATFAFYLRQQLNLKTPIALGYDPRPSSYSILNWITHGLLTQGVEIWNEGIVPSPALTYFTKVSPAQAGVMITGSHVKESMNGLKFYIRGEEVSKNQEKEIENLFAQLAPLLRPQGQEGEIVLEQQAARDYQAMLQKLAEGDFPGMKVVLDAGNGTQSEVMPQVLRRLGARVLEVSCDITKPLLSRDTETEGSFETLRVLVGDAKADFGVGYDSDGDRAAFVTNQGKVLTGDVSCGLIAKYEPGRVIVTPINTSSVVEHLGKEVFRTKVGATYVVAKMKEVGAGYGFEANGGGISAEIFYGRDAGSSTIKMLKILRQTGRTLQELVDELPKFYQVRTKTDCPAKLNEAILNAAREAYGHLGVNALDGLKFTYPNGDWLLFRPSGNAPEFRVFTEAAEVATAQKLNQQGMALVQSVIAEDQTSPPPPIPDIPR